MEKRLYKSRKDIKLDGVCAGIAGYFGFDVTIVRLVWVAATLFTAFFGGIVLYFACAVIMPRESSEIISTGWEEEDDNRDRRN